MKSKFYNFETSFRSLKDELCGFLKDNNIYYELSGMSGGWHFEVKLNKIQLAMVNNFLDNVSIIEC